MTSDTARPVTLTEIIKHRTTNIKSLQQRMKALHTVVESSLQANPARAHAAAERGELKSFTEGDHLLVAGKDFHAGESLCARWCRPRRITKVMKD